MQAQAAPCTSCARAQGRCAGPNMNENTAGPPGSRPHLYPPIPNAVSKPMPLVPPVTTATLSANFMWAPSSGRLGERALASPRQAGRQNPLRRPAAWRWPAPTQVGKLRPAFEREARQMREVSSHRDMRDIFGCIEKPTEHAQRRQPGASRSLRKMQRQEGILH
jgi:hypothetical protein